MMKFPFFEKRQKVNAKLFIISYVVSVLSVSLAILAMVGFINYFNGKGLNYNDYFILKTFKLISIGGLFAVLCSVVMIHFDKKKIVSLIHDFKQEFNGVNCEKMGSENLGPDVSPDIINEVIKRKINNGELIKLNVDSISVMVKGVNMKKIEYNAFCHLLYSSGRSESALFEFYTINNGDLKLQNIVFSIDSEPSGVLIDSPKG